MPTFSLVQKWADLDQHNAKVLAQIVRETSGDAPKLTVLSLLGDERQLRGIPSIGRGVTGAMMGSIPGRALER